MNARPPAPETYDISPLGAAVFFFYEGYFCQSIIEACADALRMRLEVAARDTKTSRRLIRSFIELAQNIIHYSAESLTPEEAVTDEVRYGALRIEEEEGVFRLHCSNPVTRQGSDRLEMKLSALAAMNLEEIKQSYREALRAPGDEESKGGGIGFLTLARESSSPLHYAFDDHPRREDFKMFNLIVTV